MRRAFVLVVIALLVAWSRRAGAERTGFALESTSSPGARACADADVLRAKVAERLGRDPFDPTAEGRGRLQVTFARERASVWTAEVALLDASGKRIGARSLSQTGATCEPLVGSVVFTIAVLLEELAPPEPSAAAPPSPAPALPPPPPPPQAASTDAPPAAIAQPASSRSTRFDVSLGGAGALGGAPAPSAGGELALGADFGFAPLRVELSGRMFLPASSDGDVGVRTRLVHGRLAPCYGWTVLAGCVVAAVGSVSGEAVGEAVASSRLAGQLHAAAGIGLLSRVFVLGDLVFVRATIDLLFAATRAGFDVGDRRVWTVPLVSGAGAVALGVRLP